MNLYKVTCVSVVGSKIPVYVTAQDWSEGANVAMRKMKDLKYRFDSYVSKVELIAGENHYHAPGLFIDGSKQDRKNQSVEQDAAIRKMRNE